VIRVPADAAVVAISSPHNSPTVTPNPSDLTGVAEGLDIVLNAVAPHGESTRNRDPDMAFRRVRSVAEAVKTANLPRTDQRRRIAGRGLTGRPADTMKATAR
jgi:hypothetical protein